MLAVIAFYFFVVLFFFIATEVLKNSVIPWWRKSYEEQLNEKQSKMCQSLIDLRKKLGAIQNLDNRVRCCHGLG